MNKAYVYAAGSTVLAVTAGILYIRKRKPETENEPSNIEQAGIPDQVEEDDLEQLENAKMVSEGSQFGVKYYNELKEAHEEN